jgi:hypothetical protein
VFMFAYNIIKSIKSDAVLDSEPQNASPMAA